MCSYRDEATARFTETSPRERPEKEKKMATKTHYIEPGTYLAKPLSWEVTDRQRKDGGTYTVYAIEFELLDETNKGKKAFYYQPLFNKEGAMTEKTAEILSKNLKAIGMTNNDPVDPNIPDPKNVNLVFVNEPYEGKDQIKIKFINSLQPSYNPRSSHVAVSEDKKKQLRAAFATASAATASSAPVTPRASGFAETSDDDIPF